VCAYVRHKFTDYEAILRSWRGKTGMSRSDIDDSVVCPVYAELRKRVDSAVRRALLTKYGPEISKYFHIVSGEAV
jgi:hypothetical protein